MIWGSDVNEIYKTEYKNIANVCYSTCNNPSLPGTVGTPAFFIVSLAVDLSPIILMLSGYKIIYCQLD